MKDPVLLPKLSLFADDVILYLEHSKSLPKELLEIINKLSRVAGYKVNTHKSVALLYAKEMSEERETNKLQTRG